MRICTCVTRRLGRTALVATACLLAALSGTARADLLWYDGFSTTDEGGDYVVGDPLGGQSGGTGTFFSGPWQAAGYPELALNTEVYPNNLSRPGLTEATVGGSASRDYLSSCCTESRTSRLMAEPWGGFTDPDGTFYVSFLANFGSGDRDDPQHRVFEMHNGGFEDDPNRQLMFGFAGFEPDGVTDLALRVKDGTAGAFAPAATVVEGADLQDLAFQGTHHVVLKFEMSTTGDDVISAFLDPVGTTEPAPSASVTVGQFLADRMSAMVQFTYNTDEMGPGFFDEIRVGSEFADVAINTVAYVPEPAAASLVGLCAAGLLGVTRRRA